MAGNSIRISTDQVAQIANELDSLNKRLTEELQACKQTVSSLRNIWQGEAANATISAFDAFAAKYFQKYEEVISQYVKFLRANVEAGYTATEIANTKLGDSFK